MSAVVTISPRPIAGSAVRSTCTFRTVAGAVADPGSSIVVRYGLAGTAGTTKTYGVDAAVVKDTTGVYHIDVPCLGGTMVIRWVGDDGDFDSISEVEFVVDASRLA